MGHTYLYELYLIFGCVWGKIVNVYPLHPYLTFTIFQNGMWGWGEDGDRWAVALTNPKELKSVG